MKTPIKSRSFIPLCVVAGLVTFAAGAQNTPFYIKADLGGTWTKDTDLKEFFGVNTTGVKVQFDPGVRLGFRAGFLVTDWFAAEAETGVLASEIDRLTAFPSRVDASFANVPFMLNARFQIPERMRISPYVGGGLGVSAAVLDADHMDLGLVRLHGTQSDAVFAYQAFAGVRCALTDRMGLSLEYHYFGTTEPEWKADFVFGTFSDRVRFGGIETHAVSLAFDYRF